MDRVYSEPYVAFTPVANAAQWITNHVTVVTRLANPLPANVQLMTFHPWNAAGSYLVRLSHQFAINEDVTLSKPTSVDLATVLPWTIASATELSLTASQNKADMQRPVYPLRATLPKTDLGVRGEPTQFIENEAKTGLKAVVVSLGPMEIKTFLVQGTIN